MQAILTKLLIVMIASIVICCSDATDPQREKVVEKRSEKDTSASQTSDSTEDLIYSLEPAQLEKCHQEGKVYDWRYDTCFEAELVKYRCNREEATEMLSHFDEISEILDRLETEGFLLDQCGKIGKEPIIFLVGLKQEGDKKSQILVKTIGMPELIESATKPFEYNEDESLKEMEKCHEAGFVYDRLYNHCHEIELAPFTCDGKGIEEEFKKVSDFKEKFKTVIDEGWEIDQCGLDNHYPVIFFKRLSEDQDMRKMEVHTIRKILE